MISTHRFQKSDERGSLLHYRLLLYAVWRGCDQYSIIGEIKEVEKVRNIYTKEEIYRMKIESHDLEFVICINSKRSLRRTPSPDAGSKGRSGCREP